MSERKKINLPYEIIAAALNRMTQEERKGTLDLADYLVDQVKARGNRVMFGRMQALELLAKIGFDMIKPTIKRAELERMERFTAKG